MTKAIYSMHSNSEQLAGVRIARKPVASQFVNPTSPHTSQLSIDDANKDTNARENDDFIGSEFPLTGEGGGSSLMSQRRAKHNTILHPLAMWKWELLSLITAALAFLAIIILLRVYEGKHLSQWKVPISINAVVAILSAIFKGSLALPIADGISQLKWLWFIKRSRNLVDMDTYDRASRSVWGSVVFLGKFIRRLQLSPLAAFGALLMLMALIVDPFSQASVLVDSCVQKQYIRNMLPYTANYSISGAHIGSKQQYLDIPMQVAVSLGLSVPPADSSDSIQSTITCPTGNCTLAETGTGLFSTISMCHKCLDVTKDLKTTVFDTFVTYPNGSRTPVEVTRYLYRHIDTDANNHTTGVAHELNIGNNLLFNNPNYYSRQEYAAPINLTAASEVSGTISRLDWGGRHFLEGGWNKTALVSFQGIAMLPDNDICQSYDPHNCNHTPFAFDCALQPCVKFLNAKVTNGVYSETEIDRHYLHFQGYAYDGMQVGLNETYVNGTLLDCSPAKERSDSHPYGIVTPETLYAFHSFDREYVWYPGECVHVLTYEAAEGLAQYLMFLFQRAELTSNTAFSRDAWLVKVWDEGKTNMSKFDDLFNGLAISIGAQMRKVAGRQMPAVQMPAVPASDTFIPGHTISLAPCIQVRWNFLVYPAILFVAELLFFAAVIVFNWKNPWHGDWKSSTLPFVFQEHRVQWPQDIDEKPAIDEKNLRRAVRRAQGKLILDESDGVWKLSTEAA